MSDSILDHGYIPEEHAPDPVIGHGDPTPPGKIAIWLFLASEIMFFIGVLGSYIILRSGSPELFSKHAPASEQAAGRHQYAGAALQLGDDGHRRRCGPEAATGPRPSCVLSAPSPVPSGSWESSTPSTCDKFDHHTIVARETRRPALCLRRPRALERDGEDPKAIARRMAESTGFDIHLVSRGDVEGSVNAATAKRRTHRKNTDPGRASPRTSPTARGRTSSTPAISRTTGVHGLHVLGGIIALMHPAGSCRCEARSCRPHRIHRPVLALCRPGLDLPVPAAVPDLIHARWQGINVLGAWT